MESPSVSLDIADVTAALREIDLAAEMAVYRGWQNIRQILALRDHLEAFINDPTNQTINVTRISDAVQVIDYACEQGAYRGWEKIREVLPMRDRLDAFATAVAAHLNTPATALDEADANAPGLMIDGA